MKENKQRKFLLVILIILIVLLTSLIIFKNLYKTENIENNQENDKSYKITEVGITNKQEISNIVFDNIKYEYDGSNTLVYFDVKNNNEKDVILHKIEFKIYDKDSNLICLFEPTLNNTLKSKESFDNVNIEIETDCKQAYALEIVLPEMEYIKE